MTGKKKKLLTLQAICSIYGLRKKDIEKLLPPPAAKHRENNGGTVRLWSSSQVDEFLSDPRVTKLRSKQQNALREAEMRRYLLSFGLDGLRRTASGMKRNFILHVGPTNSGKTYQALRELRQCRRGVYLGPLRLLALEVFDRLNTDEIPCSLLTGEESIEVPFSRITSSTIEMADYTVQYDVAVIDEAQMLTDPHRGDKWLRALFCLPAATVHLCFAPEAMKLIQSLLDSFDAEYTVVVHERMAPLVFSGVFSSLKEACPGDALIAFSRRSVLAISAELERNGIHSSTIYGSLPPASRREEVRRFASGESSVVVATDAIGMGVSLPIKRILFCETTKFDGQKRRDLLPTEIRQVAGRAGRYGIYDRGEVLTMSDEDRIRSALDSAEETELSLVLPFPEQALDSEWPLDQLLAIWSSLEPSAGISRVDMSDAVLLYSFLRPYKNRTGRKLLFRMITCPVDTGNEDLIHYWFQCCLSLIHRKPLPEPFSGTATLEECETRYKELDILHQLQRINGQEEERANEKTALCALINRFLLSQKTLYIRRCRICGRSLPPVFKYSICNRCAERRGR